MNDKYIVFKRDEFEHGYGGDFARLIPQEVEDAVVIRRQDAFAGPALHSYAASIAIVAKLIPKNSNQYASLLRIADYFDEQALLADQLAHENASKLPD